MNNRNNTFFLLKRTAHNRDDSGREVDRRADRVTLDAGADRRTNGRMLESLYASDGDDEWHSYVVGSNGIVKGPWKVEEEQLNTEGLTVVTAIIFVVIKEINRVSLETVDSLIKKRLHQKVTSVLGEEYGA